ncbi:UDP-N-acetylmuramoyl-L-alanine--D-glutamate ligase [Aliidiomarina sp. Khilg15.8]
MKVAETLQAYERIGIVGLGLTGLSCARFLLRHDIEPVLFDSRVAAPAALQQDTGLNACETYLGEFQLENLLQLDLLIVSPGVPVSTPELTMAQDAGVELISDVELFARLVDIPVVGVTGSNGKSTVASLTAHVLNACGRKAGLGGNIGTPALDLLGRDFDCIVLELSSFQLELISSLRLAAGSVLNVTPDHMDRYPDEATYARVKNRIYRGADVCVFNRDDAQTQPLRKRRLQHWVSIGASSHDGDFTLEPHNDETFICFAGQPLLATADMPLAGQYNALNVQAALALAAALGTDLECAADAVRNFRALPHRSELIAEHAGVRWVNDSKATNAGATIAAIEGFREQVSGKLILIAGGDGKGANLSVLRGPLVKVDELIVLGKDGDRIGSLKPGSHRVQTMDEAVQKAHSLATDGSLVLLAPACSSLDMFANFGERGEAFRQAVEGCYA